MIIIKIGGGLGNQMFQYALGKKLSIKNSDKFLLDTCDFSKDTDDAQYRKFGLAHFNITASIATPDQIESIKKPKIWNFIERKVFGYKHIKFEPHILKKRGGVYLDGYFQSEKYFKDIRPNLLDDLSLKEPLSSVGTAILDQIQSRPNTVSLHVRRGDYVMTKERVKTFGSYCTPEYYYRALVSLSKKKGALSVFVFSDDIEWAKKNLDIAFPVVYITNECPDYEQLMLMSMCQNHIIANSTFSWWGAWLNNKPGKIVLAPKQWIVGPNLPIDDILPHEWERI